MKKKIVLEISFLLIFLGIFQPGSAQTIGIRAGFNLSNIVANVEPSEGTSFLYNPGFQIGPTMEFQINKALYTEISALFSSKGYRFEGETNTPDYIAVKRDYNPNYIEFPLTVKAKKKIASINCMGIIGVYTGIGVGGKSDRYRESAELSFDYTEKIRWGKNPHDNGYTRADFGLVFGLGVEISKFQFVASMDAGLTDIIYPKESPTDIKNRTFSLAVVYNLLNKK